MVDYVLMFAAGAAVGVALEKFVFAKMQESGIKSRTEALSACFGEPVSAVTFTFAEVNEWIRARKDQLVNDTKAIVMKVDENTMHSLGKNLNTKGVRNYLILAVMTSDSQIKDSLLVKYEKLDQELEDILAKGNGTLVVTG